MNGPERLRALLEADRSPTEDEVRAVFNALVAGELNDIEISALLTALKTRGETPDVLVGAALALRAAALPFPRPDYECADPCGTGGDGCKTVNVSTAVAIVAATLGVPVTKHGNRSISSQCGSADVLEAVGVPVESDVDTARRCLDQAGICFLFAPQYHTGLRAAMTVRRTLRTRTIFNLLGPLLNPAAPAYQVVGVYDARWCRPVAETLARLGARGALVVHGSGLDELALHGPSHAVSWRDGEFRELTLHPHEDHPLEALAGGTKDENARWLTQLLQGQGAPAPRAAVALNTGALLWVTGRADSLRDGTRMATDMLGTSAPWERLVQWREVACGA